MKNLFAIAAMTAALFLLAAGNVVAQNNPSNQGSQNTYSNNGILPLVENNWAGVFRMKGRTGLSYTTGVEFQGLVTGPVADNFLPMDLIIRTGAPNLLERMRITRHGDVGFNMPNPESRVTIRQFFEAGNPDKNAFEVIGGNNEISLKRFRLYNQSGFLNAELDGNMDINDGNVSVHDGDVFVNDGDVFVSKGRIALGTTNLVGNHKLYIGGSAIVTRLVVEEEGNWPDYVFADTYQLMPLSQLKTTIQELNHLPGVPSEEEVAKEGVDVGEMQRILLEKVEELTLYTIRQQEEIEVLKIALEEK